MRNFTYLLFAVVFLLGTEQGSFAQTVDTPPISGSRRIENVPGVILFKVLPAYRSFCQEEKITLPDLEARFEALGDWQLRKNFPNISPILARGQEVPDLSLVYELRYEGKWSLAQALEHVRSHPAIAYAEPRYIYTEFYMPNDVYADTIFGIDAQWYLTTVKAREAWDLQRGDTAVVIGVTDSGISYLHPDLKDNLQINRKDPPDGVDNDQDGYVDNYRGWDFGGKSILGVGDNDASFIYNHGVNVAGILGATTDNGIGTASVAFNCRYLPVKSGPDDAPGAITHGYESILYAAQQGAQVITCSWGGQVRSQLGHDVIKYVVIMYQAAIVAACGNTPEDLRFYPAAYPEVLSVTNVHQQDSICCPQYASLPGQALGTTYNYSVDVAAPGWRLLTPTNDKGYANFSGTSASAPLAAAAVGLILAHFPNYSGLQAAQRLRVTTDDIYELPYNQPFRYKMGTGRINVFRALSDPLKPSIRQQTLSVNNTQGADILSLGDTLVIEGDFVNFLDPSSPLLELQVVISDSTQQAHLEILQGNFLPGVVPTLGTFSNASHPFLLRVKQSAPENMAVVLRLTYLDTALQYKDFEILEFRVNPTVLDITENRFHTSLSSNGNFGYGDYPVNEVGLGVQFRGDERSALFEGGFLLGNGPSGLLDNLRDAQGGRNRDFAIKEKLRPQASSKADFVAKGVFDDTNAPASLGVEVTQRVFAWEEPEDEDYIIVEYVIHNTSSNMLTGLYGGLMADWDLGNPETDACTFDPLTRMVFAFDIDGSVSARFGMGLLSPGQLRAAAFSVPSFSFSDSAKFEALSNIPTGTSASAGLSGSGADIVHFLSTGPFDLAAGDSQTVTFVLMGGRDFPRLQDNVRRALKRYRCDILEEGPVEGFAVSANPAPRNQPIQFSDLNTGTISWEWSFGDGDSSLLPNPQHTYGQVGDYTVRFTTSDGDCQVTRTTLVQVRNITTGLDADLFGSVNVFPNPSGGKFWLEVERWPAGMTGVEVVNLLGQTVWASQDMGERVREIDLSGQPAGVYWVKLSHPSGTYGVKVLRE